MGKINEIYVRETRNELGRYPTWPPNKQMHLGMIGFYHGREAVFDWETDLNAFGVNVPSSAPQQFMHELYTSRNSVSIEFGIDDVKGNPKVMFGFEKSSSVATQGHMMGYQTLDIKQLKSRLLQCIDEGMKWDYNYVIITEIWTAVGFTTLISNSSNSFSHIVASKSLPQANFNVADINLGLGILKCKKMAYQGVAEKNIQPYFQVHRLTKDNKLKKYGSNMSFWG